MSDSLRPHGPQHARLPYPTLSPTVFSNSCPLRQWCHPSISSSVIPVPFSQSLPDQDRFQGVGSSHKVAKVLGFRLQHQFFQWIFSFDLLAVQGTLKSLLQYHSSNASIFWCLAFLMAQLSHPYLKFIFCKNTKISTNCWTTVDRRMLEPTKKKIPYI